ncbi:MAG: M64 family metallopeptidase, partial [Gemmataceae bacterium]|nr:M64 family metallopeptidase [Gemmataceae bacterium]
AIRAVRAAAGEPVDNLVVIVNEPGYGGGARAAADMPAAAYHAHKAADPIPYEDALKAFTFGLTVVTCDAKVGGRVLIHELGHSFADLGEEYFDPAVAFPAAPHHPALRKPNLSPVADPDRVKWKALIGAERVGVFEGAEGFGRGLYRPWDDGCVMRRPEHLAFCPVCRRAVEAELRAVLDHRG